jgi:hypothetical protein
MVICIWKNVNARFQPGKIILITSFSMKKQIYSIGILSLFMGFLSFTAYGQLLSRLPGLKAEGRNTRHKIAANPTMAVQSSTQPGNSIQNLWDVKFFFDPAELSGDISHAAVCYAKGFFWVSKWSSADSLFLFDSTAEFVAKIRIANIGALRSITFDGTFLYGANTTRQIQVINPETRTRVRQFAAPTTAIGQSVRWITYNSEGNNGLGSFFIGDYGTAIAQISKPTGATATLLSSIPAATHGLEGMYGGTYEANGANSKFYIFDQNQAESGAVIVQLNANGVQTGITRNVDDDSPNGEGIAGGIQIADVPGYGKTLIALSQGSGIVGYDVTPPTFDAAMDSLAISNKLIAYPKKWNTPVTFGGRVQSIGISTLANFSPKVEIKNAETEELIQALQVPTMTVVPGVGQTFTTAPLVNGLLESDALYFAEGTTNYPGDQNGDNDTLAVVFGITDSTIVKTLGYYIPEFTSPIGIGAGANEEKMLGARFTIPASDTLTSVSYYLVAPFENEGTSVSIYSVTGNQIALTPIRTSATYTATSDDEQDGVLVTLALDPPVSLPAGEFVVAVNELGDSTAGLGSLTEDFQPNTYYVRWNTLAGGAWSDLSGFGAGLRRAFAIFPNFGRVPVSTTTLAVCTTSVITDITLTGATATSSVISDGGATVTERGVVWSTNPLPTIALTTKTVDGNGTGEFVSVLTDLMPNTTYYLRSYATNSVGTTYGNQIFFTTLSTNTIATTATAEATNITLTSATSGGTISADGGAPVTAKGVVWSTSPNPTIALSTKTFDGTGTAAFVSQLTGLTPNTTYFARSYAQNSVGVAYGNEITFITTVISVSTILEKGKNMNLVLYPNPSTGAFAANLFTEKGGKASIKIMNSVGQVVEESTADLPAGEFTLPFNASKLNAGMYFFTIQLDGQVISRNLIKE